MRASVPMESRYGYFTLTGKTKRINGVLKYECICDCGNVRYVPAYKLRTGASKSCGCRKKKYDIHNQRIFSCWWNMKDRCNGSHRKDYKYYGGKGIKVCAEWNDYQAFERWALEHGYDDSLTLDRIDSNKDYCPNNCRWISIQEQQRNRSSCRYYTLNGVTKTLAEWSREYGINRATVSDRIDKSHLSFEDALTKQLWWEQREKHT